MYLFRLAERLGYTVGELSHRLSMAELRDWLAVEEIRARPNKPEAPTVTLDQARAAMKSRIKRAS